MEATVNIELLKNIPFFRGLNDVELEQVAELGRRHSYAAGELCQVEGQSVNRVHIILQGRVGTVLRIPNLAYSSSEIIIDPLKKNDIFGWSTLLKGTPWSTLKALEPTEIMYFNSDELLKLCESNYHVGYELMRHLASLISSRLRRNRASMINTLVSLKGEG